jgi:hypothetical protein
MTFRPLLGRLSVALLLNPPVFAATAPPRPLGGIQAAALERTRAGAARRLEQPACVRVLEEFRDAAGRRLAENLAAFDSSPSDYLRMIPFLDGSSEPLCVDGRAYLVTVMGIHRVLVCPGFVDKELHSPRTAEALLIHEMLHTLGLGENPPSSSAITARVSDRCP